MSRWLITTVESGDAAAVRDARAVLSEYEEHLSSTVGHNTLSAELETLPAPYVRPGGVLLLARDESGTPAGCVGVREHSGTECEIKRLYVRPEVRGAGLGRALVRAAIDHARALGYSEMVLVAVEATTERAQRIYRSLGFEVTPQFRELSRAHEGIDFLYMRRAL